MEVKEFWNEVTYHRWWRSIDVVMQMIREDEAEREEREAERRKRNKK